MNLSKGRKWLAGIGALFPTPPKRGVPQPPPPLASPFRSVLATLLFLVAGVSAQTSPLNLTPEERAFLKENRDKLTLYFNTTYPPIEFQTPGGAFTGMGADVFDRVEKALGISFPRRPMPDWNHHLRALREGTCALAPTIVQTRERESYLSFTTPYATVPVVIITSRQIQGRISLKDLSGMKVGVVSGFATEPTIREQASRYGFETVTVPDVPTGLESLAFGQMDAFVENLAVAAYYIEAKGIPSLRVAGITDQTYEWRVGVSRHYPLLFSAVQKALSSIPKAELEAIYRKWITLDLDLGMNARTLFLLRMLGLMAVVLVTGLGISSAMLRRRLRQKITALEASENRYRRLAENSPALVFQLRRTLNGTLSFPYLSELSRPLLDLERADVSRNPGCFLERIDPEDRDSFQDEISRSSRTLQAFHIRFRFHRGDRIAWLEAHASPAPLTEEGVLWDGFLMDVTAQVLAETQVRESEQRLRLLIRNSSDSISILNAEGTQIFVSPAAERLTGFPVEELIGTSLPEIIHPDDMPRVLEAWREALAHPERTVRVQYRHIHKTRGHVFMEAVGQNFLAEPAINGVVVSVRDISEWMREQEERDALQEQLAQAQKMDSVGRLAGGVAHDFNNMLGVIMGHAEMALRKTNDTAPLAEDLREIMRAAERSSILTRHLLAFARKQTVNPRTLDLNRTIEQSLRMLKTLTGEDVTLTFVPGIPLGPVRVDPSQIDHILVNLCVNARDALDTTRNITISTRSLTIQSPAQAPLEQMQAGTYVHLSVTDTGRGMDPETLEHIFEPFFTTKEVGKGTGLGLASVYGIVQQNHGHISVTSSPGVGTTFSIFFPQQGDDPGSGTHEQPHPEPLKPGQGHILLVEDEPMVLEITQTMLLQMGYTVTAVSSPAGALSLPPETVLGTDLLVTDMIMPGMNGEELIQKLRATHPSLKCLFISGYTEGILGTYPPERGSIPFLQKPFSPGELAQSVRALLTGDGSASL